MIEGLDLKNCPFCGATPTVHQYDGTDGHFGGLQIDCPTADCPAGGLRTVTALTDNLVAWRAWNTRAPDPRVTALVEAAEALGVREMVAGWNGEGRETPYAPHPPHLWAKISTTCGAVYALDAALAAFKGGADG